MPPAPVLQFSSLLLTLALLGMVLGGHSHAPVQQAGVFMSQTQQGGSILGNRRSLLYHWQAFPSRKEAETAGFRAAKNCPVLTGAPQGDAVMPEPLAPGAVPPAP